jgi:hypothetical protein
MVFPAILFPFPYGPGGGSDQTGKVQAGILQQFSVNSIFSAGALADQAENVMHGRLFPFFAMYLKSRIIKKWIQRDRSRFF